MDSQIPRPLLVTLILLLFLTGCAHRFSIERQQQQALYTPKSATSPTRVRDLCPQFLVHGFEKAYNRIGQPVADTGDSEDVRIRIDPDRPAVYTMVRPFITDRGRYTNYIYRIHFREVPFSLYPFHLTAGNNVGLIVVITTNEKEKPVLITTVHTCGCYLAIVPTTSLPAEALPADWDPAPVPVYGETLPSRLDFSGFADARLRVSIRPGVHRVMHLDVVDSRQVLQPYTPLSIPMPLLDASHLYHLHDDEGDTISFYHHQGIMSGHVRGSIKPWETLLMSLISLDLFVGTDKAYDDPARTGNLFYTSLKPWNRTASDMWHFERFLRFWGWRL